MTRVLRRDSSCVDVGAHSGDILKHMLRLAPDGIHHAFEPLPHLAEELRVKFPTVILHQVAASDQQGQSSFQYVENDPAYSGLRTRIYDRLDPKVRTIQVVMTTIDQALPSDQPIKFMKLDIEGGEYHALRGATNTISRLHPVIVFEAGWKSTGQYGVTPDEVFQLISVDLGYEISTMRRCLDEKPAYSTEEFRRNWYDGKDYYFIATLRSVSG